MDSIPLLIATRPLVVFLLGAAAVLLSALIAWWIVQRLRAPVWNLVVWTWRRASGTWPALSRLRLPVAWLGTILLVDLALGFAVVFVAIGAFFEMADEIDLDEDLGEMDNAIASELARSASPATLRTFAWITHLGDAAVQWGIGVGVALFLIATGRRFLAVTWIAAVAGNGALNRLLKAWFQRDRPLHEHGFTMADGWSFPSGHASGAVAVYGMLAYLACRVSPPAWRLPIVLAALVVVLLVGYSRVVLQVHYASDVLAGFLTAGAWLIVCVGAAHLIQVHRLHRSPPQT